ncbi:MAG: S41 family peptidase [Bacteroidota bacterium]
MYRLLLLIIITLLNLNLGAQTSVNFIVKDLPRNNQLKVGIRGSEAPLSWTTSKEMKPVDDHYEIELSFPTDIQEVEFKFVLFNAKDEATWESNDNRFLRLKGQSKLTSSHQWDQEQLIELSALPLLQPEQLLEDYQLIEKMVLDIHPGTYRYNDKASIQANLAALKATFQQPLSYRQAYLAMSKLTASLQCNHTMVGIYNQKATINSLIHRQADKLPFSFTWIDDQMIVLENASNIEGLKRGARILSIDQRPVAEIQATLVPYMPADGATDHQRKAYLAVSGYDFTYYPFDVFYPLVFPVKNGQVEIEFQNFGDKEIQTASTPTLTREQRMAILQKRYSNFPNSNDDLWGFEITDDKIGILTLNSFTLYGYGKLSLDYKAYLADIFRQLKKEKIQQLIIDIRENSGGNDEIKYELFKYLSYNKNAPGFERVGKTRYLEFPEMLKPHIKTWGDNPWFYYLEPDQPNPVDGYYTFTENEKDPSSKKKKDAFTGEVYLMTSAVNVSLAFYLAADFKQKQIGKIYGAETGGNQRDINGGQILFLYLPNSGIEVEFPVMGGFTLAERPNRGIIPDVFTKPTQAGIANGIDDQLNHLLMEIRN